MIRNPFRNLDQKKLSRSSDALKAQNDYMKIVNRRIFVFGIIIVLIFCIIAMRLLFIQVREKDNYTAKLESYSSQKQIDATSRGEMLDRNGKVLAKTVAAHNIIYFPPKNVTSDEQWKLAQKFAKDFDVKSNDMTNSDYQDLYLFLHKGSDGKKDNGRNLLTKDELSSNLTSAEQEKRIRSRITKKMVDELADDKTKNAFSVYLAMRKFPANQNKVILEDVDDDKVAKLTEHKENYPGFDVDLGSWKREYPYKSMLRDVLGTITTTKQGIPSELKQYYEAKGYALTDRVGKSGLEQEYEPLLRGTPKVSNITYDKGGTAIMNETVSGKNGYDLHLTIDADLQTKVDKILEDIVKKYAGTPGREKFNKAIVVMMNPETGEIYTMSGMYKDGKDIVNYSSGAYLDAYVSGSVVKGATVYMMLDNKIQTRTSTEVDAPIKIQGTAPKSSFHNYGPVNAIMALGHSSNVYMWLSVIKLAGGTYKYDQPLNIDNTHMTSTFKIMRNYYSMFGLGTKTGLDVPNETSGLTGSTQQVGNLLDFAIGQYDLYTPMQLVQYVSTIANGGKKVEPKLVNTATDVNSKNTIFENKTKVLSTLPGSKQDLETIQLGFREVVNLGAANALGKIKDLPIEVAAKTGTAQVKVDNKDYTNASLIGYAPYGDHPKVAFACSVPTSAADSQQLEGNLCATEIMPEVLKEFFKKY